MGRHKGTRLYAPALMACVVGALSIGTFASAQEAEPPADSQTEQSDESYEESLRKRDRDVRDFTTCPPGIQCSGTGSLPPIRPIDRLPAESAEHIQRARIRIVRSVGVYDAGDTADKYPYEPSVAAQLDPSLQALEKEAWEELVDGIIADARVASGLPSEAGEDGQGGGEEVVLVAGGGGGGSLGEAGEQGQSGENGGNEGGGSEGGGSASASSQSEPEIERDETDRLENRSASIYGWSRPDATFGGGNGSNPNGNSEEPGQQSGDGTGAPQGTSGPESGGSQESGGDGSESGSQGEGESAGSAGENSSETADANSGQQNGQSGDNAGDQQQSAAQEGSDAEEASNSQEQASASDAQTQTPSTEANTERSRSEESVLANRSAASNAPDREPTFLERLLGLVAEREERVEAETPPTAPPAEVSANRRRALSGILNSEPIDDSEETGER